MRITLAAALFIGLSACESGTGGDDGNGDNPDPGHIDGAPGDALITLTPRGDEGDFDNLDWAVSNVSAGGTVALSAGTFFLGDGVRSPKRTVAIKKGMRIVGEGDGEDWQTRIEGGGEMGDWGLSGFQLENGPFRLENYDDPNPVEFEGIRFSGWTAEAIYIEACNGFAIRRCRIDSPVAGTAIVGISAVHALFSSGPYARGDFIAEDNRVELGGYPDPLPHDEQFLGVFFSYHDNIRVTGNQIVGLDEGIEILGNRTDLSVFDVYPDFPPPSPGEFEILVADNRIDVTQIFDDAVWAGKFGILVGGNQAVSSVRILRNEVSIRGTERGYAFALSGEKLAVTDNIGHLEAHGGVYPGGALLIGFAYDLAPIVPTSGGPSLVDSVVENNRFDGTAAGPAVYFHDVTQPFSDLPVLFRGTEPNLSHGNRFDLGDSVAALGAAITLAIPPGAYDNIFSGNVGTVLDLSPPGANQY